MAPGSTTGRLVNQTKRRYHAPSVPMISWNADEAVKRLSDTIKPALSCRATSSLGIEQAVQVHDEIAHVRVVDGLLRLRLPGDIGGGIVRINADDVELVEILELRAAEIGQFAADDEMEELFRGIGHRLSLGSRREPQSRRTRACGRGRAPGWSHGGRDRLRSMHHARRAGG